MSRNLPLMPFCVAILAIQGARGEDDFAESEVRNPDPPRPERLIQHVPESVVSKALGNGHWAYLINGFYLDKGDEDRSKELGSTYKAFIPSCTNVDINVDQQTCTLRTSRELTRSELAYAIDDLAFQGGGMPYWVELEARDLPKSEEFNLKHYSIERFQGELPKGLAWHPVERQKPFSAPLVSTTAYDGELLITPATAGCMCHSKYSVRVRGEKSEIIWEADAAIAGSIQIATADIDEDGVHEALVRIDDHGKNSKLILKPARRLAGQPSEEEKPSGEGR